MFSSAAYRSNASNSAVEPVSAVESSYIRHEGEVNIYSEIASGDRFFPLSSQADSQLSHHISNIKTIDMADIKSEVSSAGHFYSRTK